MDVFEIVIQRRAGDGWLVVTEYKRSGEFLPLRQERDRALDEVNAISEESLDLGFRALALGQEPPAYDDRCPFPGLAAFQPDDLEDGLPSWAYDAAAIAFTSRREGDRASRLYRANGGERGLGVLAEYASAFPDGRLAIKGCTQQGECGLFTTGAEGGPLESISANTSDTAPAPSPDGAQIAFMSSRDGNWEIYLMGSSGGNVTRLTDDAANDGLPAWSPDGQIIAFASDRDGVWAIWAMNADGSDQRKLFNMGGSPNGVVGYDVDNSKGWFEERIS